MNVNSFDDIQHIIYINLDSRVDRKIHVELELKKMGLIGERMSAIEMDIGSIGCSLSHLKCIQMAKEKMWDHILILEDDILFLDPILFKKQINSFFKNQLPFDVLLFAGNNIQPFLPIQDFCIQVSHCQTTTGYLVKNHYYDTLIENIKKGVSLLMKYPNQHFLYAIDKFWLSLQKKDKWFLITPLSVIQRDDYSNIEKKYTDYRKVMLSLIK
jgi:glycosyl transferase family 25